jgi:L-threonylcarbamoyladenylate synthase
MSRLRRATQQELEAAVTALRNGELVAFPTETVYGLGANARDPSALRRIFEAKRRPANHPLILHLDSIRFLPRWAHEIPAQVEVLADRLWPGPLTLVLKRNPEVSEVLTGGQDTIAIRIPSHPMALQLLTAFGGGIAAPSANRYGRLSPTRAEHVREELGDAVSVILDGGESTIGLESTIVSLVDGPPRLLRPGAVRLDQLRELLPDLEVGPAPGTPRTPGSMAQHYAPQTRVVIVSTPELEPRIEELLAAQRRVAVLAQRPPRLARANVTWINAGRRADVYQHDLYANLRSLDKAGAAAILVEEVPDGLPWAAVRDRLARASAPMPVTEELP